MIYTEVTKKSEIKPELVIYQKIKNFLSLIGMFLIKITELITNLVNIPEIRNFINSLNKYTEKNLNCMQHAAISKNIY